MSLNAAEIETIQLGFLIGRASAVCEKLGRGFDDDDEDEDEFALLLRLNDQILRSGDRMPRSVSLSGLRHVSGRLDDPAFEPPIRNRLESVTLALRQISADAQRDFAAKGRAAPLFALGECLAQSRGYLGGFTGEWFSPDDEPYWDFLQAEMLTSLCAAIGISSEEVSGIPADLKTYLSSFDQPDRTIVIYHEGRWGWGVIEAKLAELVQRTRSNPLPDSDEAVNQQNAAAAFGLSVQPDKRSIVLIRKTHQQVATLTQTEWIVFRQYLLANGLPVANSVVESAFVRTDNPDKHLLTQHVSKINKKIREVGLRIDLAMLAQAAEQGRRLMVIGSTDPADHF